MPLHQIMLCILEHVPVKWFVHWCSDVRVMAVAVLTTPTVLTVELPPNGKGAATYPCLRSSDPLYHLVYIIAAHISVKIGGHWMSVDHTFAGLFTSLSCCLDSLRALTGICIPRKISAPIADHFHTFKMFLNTPL